MIEDMIEIKSYVEKHPENIPDTSNIKGEDKICGLFLDLC